MTPMISILMPVYNGEKYLREAIESILNQTYKKFEFIIINDGSMDKSVEIIQKYEDSRIRLIHNKENMGLIFTLNRGLDLANGKYIARIDADDISLPKRLKIQIDFMENNLDCGLCYTNGMMIDAKSNIICREGWRNQDVPLEWYLLWGNPIAHPSVLFRSEIIRYNNLRYNKKYLHAEDYDLWWRIALLTKICHIDSILIKYRVLATSAFHSNKRNAFSNALKSNKEYINYLISYTVPDFQKYLTDFSSTVFDSKEYYPLKDVFDWQFKLYLILKQKYSFNEEDSRNIEVDILKRMCDYIFKYSNVTRIRYLIEMLFLRKPRLVVKMNMMIFNKAALKVISFFNRNLKKIKTY